MTTNPNLLKLPKLDFTTADNAKESILYKGDSGTGKTANCLSWPQPIIAIYTEKNQRTLIEAVKRGVKVEAFQPRTWAEVSGVLVPAIKNREFAAETIMGDTADGIGSIALRDLAGPQGQMDQQKWGRYLDRMRQLFDDITDATRPLPGKPSYNVVFATHTKDVTDDKGNLIKIRSAIPGQFKDEIEAFFDTVLLCASRTRAVEVEENGRRFIRQEPYYICRSIPPDNFSTCKGHGLPAEVGGTYPELMAAWGRLDNEPEGS